MLSASVRHATFECLAGSDRLRIAASRNAFTVISEASGCTLSTRHAALNVQVCAAVRRFCAAGAILAATKDWCDWRAGQQLRGDFEVGIREPRENSSLKPLAKTATRCAALLMLTPAAAFAQLALTAAADAQYEYNSNVFDLQRGFPTPLGNNSYSDSLFAYGGKLDATYLVSQQQFHLLLAGSEFHYDRFTLLNHSEYTLDGSWNLNFGSLVDGLVEVDRDRTMVSLYNLVNAQLAVQTEQREAAKFGVKVTPDWRAEVGGYTRHVDLPLVGAPNLALSETSGEAAVKYTGTADLTAGLEGGYLQGDYTGNTSVVDGVLQNVAPSYHQYNVAVTATDVVSGLSTFVGQIGYTKRSAESEGIGAAINSASGVTGLFDYRRALTGKTTVDASLSRVISAYITGAGSELDTIASLNAIWQATVKTGVTLGYNYTYRQLPDQGTVVGTNRTDRLNFIALTLDYEPTSWLSLKPYANYQVRSSTNFVGGDFNASVFGVKFQAQLERGAAAPPQPFQVPEFQF
jgi:hypothetical protein